MAPGPPAKSRANQQAKWWIIFAVRSVIFVAAGTLIAPSARIAVAIILGVIHALASENPINNSACRLATVLGTSGAVGYFIAALG